MSEEKKRERERERKENERERGRALTLAIRELAAVVIPPSRGRILREPLFFQTNHPAAIPLSLHPE